MAIQLTEYGDLYDKTSFTKAMHLLVILPETAPKHFPGKQMLMDKLARQHRQYDTLVRTPVSADMSYGAAVAWVVLKKNSSSFERYTILRKACMLLLQEYPETLTIVVLGDEIESRLAAESAVFVALLNGDPLHMRKSKPSVRALQHIALYGWKSADAFGQIRALAAGNLLARNLTVMPSNELNCTQYRSLIKSLVADNNWQHEELDIPQLQKMGAGAFLAVAQGSSDPDAAIVRLLYNPPKFNRHVALVGKGICFDTGGHNLKSARHMQGMHEDMNGSAVVLGILLAASQMQFPIKLEAWLAIAQNSIGSKAYKQNDVIQALNGKTIEIMHTDAEGRMVLADALTLASRHKPHFLIDYATLTSSMAVALGTRYSGVLGNNRELIAQVVLAGEVAGERMCAFPFDEDYDADLESAVADLKQCSLEAEADHILAARFLSQFIEGDVPWAHIDLSASNCKGGLGAVASDVNGFGVCLGMHVLNLLHKAPNGG